VTPDERSRRIRSDPPGHHTTSAQERARAWRHHDALTANPLHATLVARVAAAEVELAAARRALADAVPTRACERCHGGGQLRFAPVLGCPDALPCPPCFGTGRVLATP
jgi:cytochrome c5